jgi:hypothetical protein
MATLTLRKPDTPPASDAAPRPDPGPPKRMVHQPADPATIAWNQAREAAWHAEQAAELSATNAALIALDRLLRDLCPAVFCDPPVPLAIGIRLVLVELLAGEVDAATIAVFLRRWTGRPAYWAALAAGEMRRDLDGQPAGEPTPEQRKHAAA